MREGGSPIFFTSRTCLEHGALAWYLRTATSELWVGRRHPWSLRLGKWMCGAQDGGIQIFAKLFWKKDYPVGLGRAEGGQMGRN